MSERCEMIGVEKLLHKHHGGVRVVKTKYWVDDEYFPE